MTASLIGFSVLFVLCFLGLPLGWGMIAVGAIGLFTIRGWEAALFMTTQQILDFTMSYGLSVLPMFILMGALIHRAGLSEELFGAARAWFGHFRGGLAQSTVAASAAFGAVCGSSLATAATMAKVALPPMKRSGYDDGLACGVVAAGGTLGILIPPSVPMVIYGILTETIAGILPGLLLAAMMIAWVIYRSLRDGVTTAGTPREIPSWAERRASLSGIWPVLLLFVIVMGAIYAGIATTTEAAALGAIGALLLTIARPDMRLKGLSAVLLTTAQSTAMLMLLIIFGSFFGFVVSRLGIAHGIVEAVTAAQMPGWMVLGLYIVALLVLGCFMDPASMMVITLPLAFPVLKELGYDPIWLGVIVTITVEIGMITPPVGLNLFVLKGIVPKEVSMTDIIAGAIPFVGVLIAGLLIIVAFPGIATWLPALMKQ